MFPVHLPCCCVKDCIEFTVQVCSPQGDCADGEREVLLPVSSDKL